MTLEEARANLGQRVVYSGWATEFGVITSVGDRYVFVRYDGDAHSKATEARDLKFFATWSRR